MGIGDQRFCFCCAVAREKSVDKIRKNKKCSPQGKNKEYLYRERSSMQIYRKLFPQVRVFIFLKEQKPIHIIFLGSIGPGEAQLPLGHVCGCCSVYRNHLLGEVAFFLKFHVIVLGYLRRKFLQLVESALKNKMTWWDFLI